MGLENWLAFSFVAFSFVAFLATLIPGPAALLVTIHSLSYGFKKSLFTILGNIAALFLMSSVSILGLTALVMMSAFAFTVVKVLGAVYLVYLGIKVWKFGIQFNASEQRLEEQRPNLNLFVQGLLVALTNPKAIVFTTALFPQFISATEPLMTQFSILVATFMALSFVCLCTYSFIAQSARTKINTGLSSTFLNRLFGSAFVGAGFYLATSSR
jgi:threonine/homoserine/homoserine lactone efflux protein